MAALESANPPSAESSPDESEFDSTCEQLQRELSPGQTLDIAFSSDGTRVATAHDSKVVVWDVASGVQTHVFGDDFERPVYGVAFSPSGERLAAVSYGTTVVRELGDGSVVRRVTQGGPYRLLHYLEISGREWVVAARGGYHTNAPAPQVIIIDVASDAVHSPFEERRTSHSVAVAHNRHAVVVRTAPMAPVAIWRGPELGTIELEDGAFAPMAVSDTTVVTSSDTGVHTWDIETGSKIRDFIAPEFSRSMYHEVAISPDSQRLAAVFDEFEGLLWDVPSGALVGKLPVLPPETRPKVDFTPDSRHIMITIDGMSAWRSDEVPPSFWLAPASDGLGAREIEFGDWIYGFDVTQDGRLLAIGGHGSSQLLCLSSLMD